MIKITKGFVETNGAKKEMLIDFAGIVNHLHTNCGISKNVLLDFVNIGLSPDKETAKKVSDIFEKVFGQEVVNE